MVRLAVAGRYAERERIKAVLALEGLPTDEAIVTASWLYGSQRDDGDLTHDAAASQVSQNLFELRYCDVLVVMPSWTPSPGRFVDLGAALMLNKPIMVLGDQSSDLFRHSIYLRPGVVTYCQLDGLLEAIKDATARKGGFSAEEQE